MRQYHFQYHMDVSFSKPINDHSFTLKCIPIQREFQQVTILKQEITPITWISNGLDLYGNAYVYGFSKKPHTSFSCVIEGLVSVHRKQGYPMYISNNYEEMPTNLTHVSKDMQLFAKKYIEKMDDFTECLTTIMNDIYTMMSYMPGTTSVSTTAIQTFDLKCGVCQDYAHIMLAILRYLHIPCFYIAGFMEGEGASHAWVRVVDKKTNHTYELDPTNNKWVDDHYIEVACGKDADDCKMNKGIYRGYAIETQQVHVIVEGKDHL